MPVEPVSSPGVASMYANPATRAPKQEYDSELFLELLVTQLRNQDPSSSMETSEIVAQTTSLAMMEAMNTVSDTVEEAFGLQMRAVAAEMLGNEVSYTDAAGATRTGTATSVSYSGAVPTITVGGAQVPLDQVTGVTTQAGTDAQAMYAGATDGIATTA